MTWSLEHYNLICHSRTDRSEFNSLQGIGAFPADRLFEYTIDELRHRYEGDYSSLAGLPTLVVAEADPRGEPTTSAFLMDLSDIRQVGDDIRYRFRRIPTEPLSSEEVFGASIFDIIVNGWGEHTRTHWAVKEGNLIEGLFKLFADRWSARESTLRDLGRPKLFGLEDWPSPVTGQVAVMMPFDGTFDRVYETINGACGELKLNALRVDDIFGPTVVMTDVFTVIVQSRVVICDLTRRNPNVLYETGIAHACGCDVIMIVQNKDDIPFDLRHIRYLTYLPNGEGLEDLRRQLIEWLRVME